MTQTALTAGGSAPRGRRATICLTFDNLGEAADIEMGSWPADRPIGQHYTATTTVPRLIDTLDGIAATFFVEGWNTGIYPKLVREIADRGHEVACHGWRHELWTKLDSFEQQERLERALEGFEEIGISIGGLRPPGGALTDNLLDLARSKGFDFISTAGRETVPHGDIVSLPFRWIDLDGFYIDPAAAKRVGLEIAPGTDMSIAGFFRHCDAVVDDLAKSGGHAVFVMHPYLIETTDGYWNLLQIFLARLKAADGIDIMTCGQFARQLIAVPERRSGSD